MSEFSPPSAEPQPEPLDNSQQGAFAAPPAPPARRRSAGLPPWLPYFLLAVVPAVIVGLVVYATAGGGGGGNAAGVLDGFIRLGPSGGEGIESFEGKLPPGFPKDLPVYPGSKVIVSFLIQGNSGNSYFAVYQSSDSPDEVLSFFQDRLDKSPWQVQVSQASSQFSGVQFTRPDNANVQGDVAVNRSEIDHRTSIYVSFQDLAPSGQQRPLTPDFVLPASRSLPPGFPSDVPIFHGREKSTVTATYFERGSGAISYYVSFLTKESQDTVIAFYKAEFRKLGWQVTDSTSTPISSFQLAIEFRDGPRQQVQGSIRADSFKDDANYTKVDLLLEVSASRGRGN